MGLAPRKIQFKCTWYDVHSAVNTGHTANVYKTTAGPVIKQFRQSNHAAQFEREAHWLSRLNETAIAPALLDTDASRLSIMMDDCGEPISRFNAPPDWEKQLDRLMQGLRDNGCAHNDLSEKEILVKDDALRIVDFAFALPTEAMAKNGCFPFSDIAALRTLKKSRYFLDRHIAEYMRLRLSGAPAGSEPHCFVLWKADELEHVHAEIAERFDVLRAIIYMPGFVGHLGCTRKEFLRRFYAGRDTGFGDKAKQPFVLFYVLDRHPHYAIRRNPFRGDEQIVNVNTFDLKNRLRQDRNGFLHGSDTIQECFDNLDALSYYDEQIPKAYWAQWQPSFNSIAEFFDRLNNEQALDYVVLRNFDDIEESGPAKGSDIDLLVDDYYAFKRVSGALGFKHKRSHRSGPALEYGGYKVSGKIRLANQNVVVDIRYVGDNYYCSKWQADLLKERTKNGSFYVPAPVHHFYSLLYHALVHKETVSDDYRRRIGRMAPSVGLSKDLARSDDALWACLDSFMERQGYEYVRPNELSIPLSRAARARLGITPASELAVAQKAASEGRFLHAADRLRALTSDGVVGDQARALLASMERPVERPQLARRISKALKKTRLGQFIPKSMKQPIKELVSNWDKSRAVS